MMKMESRKSRPRWWNSFFGPKNSNHKWLQENLEEMNQTVRRMLKLIKDSDADSFAKKVEMYHQRKQELINLVEKCYRIHCSLVERYNHATQELLKNIPNSDPIRPQGRGISLSNVSASKSSTPSPPPLPLFNTGSRDQGILDVASLKPSSTIPSPPPLPKLSLGSKQLKRVVSVKRSKYHNCGKLLTRPAPTFYSAEQYSAFKCSSESEDLFISSSLDTQYNDDGEELQHEGAGELEAELRNMIEKLYIQLEGDRVVSKLEGEILRHEDNTCDDDGEFREVKESVSSNVNKELFEETVELQGEISKLLKKISCLEECNEGTNERCESLEEAVNEARAERKVLASEVERLKVSIVTKNYNMEELNKILEAVVAERDQLKARIAILDVDPK